LRNPEAELNRRAAAEGITRSTLRRAIGISRQEPRIDSVPPTAAQPLGDERQQSAAEKDGEKQLTADRLTGRLAETPPAPEPSDSASILLLRLFTNGIVDDRIVRARRVLADDKLTANEKLTKIDALIRIPATASAEQLGEMLGLTKQAVLKTNWWIENRKGEKDSEIGRRRAQHQRRAHECEEPKAEDLDSR